MYHIIGFLGNGSGFDLCIFDFLVEDILGVIINCDTKNWKFLMSILLATSWASSLTFAEGGGITWAIVPNAHRLVKIKTKINNRIYKYFPSRYPTDHMSLLYRLIEINEMWM